VEAVDFTTLEWVLLFNPLGPDKPAKDSPPLEFDDAAHPASRRVGCNG
jgi:hypothetical protein